MFLSSSPRRILGYSEPVDMRKSFDGLVAVVQNVLGEDPLSDTLFMFLNRRGNYMKLVTWVSALTTMGPLFLRSIPPLGPVLV